MHRIKSYEELTISDNFIFQKVMQNQRICKRLIEKLLNIKVKNITYPDIEKSIAPSMTQKSIRLDLYVETDNGTILDIEMQTTDGSEGWLAKRTRYYQSMIDLDTLSRGSDYVNLKTSYVIFICTFDPFPEYNRKIYTFRNRCDEDTGLELGDNAVKMFLSAKGTIGEVDKDIDSFLRYIDGKNAEGNFTQNIDLEVNRVKEHKEMRVEYMSFLTEIMHQRRFGFSEGKVEGRAEGLAEGRAEMLLQSIRSLMEKLEMSAQQAMDVLGIPASEREKYASLV